MKVLLVEDDDAIAHALGPALQEAGYRMDVADNGPDGFFLAEAGTYDVIILDIMLPGQNGLDVLKALRAGAVPTPVLLLTAKDAVADKVKGLDAGADDYLVKPFSLAELLARLRVLLRRQLGTDEFLSFGSITVDVRAHQVVVKDQPVHLTVKEYDVLEFFVRNAERIVYREQIFDRVWGFDSEAGPTVVDVYVHYLRKKLAKLGAPEGIHTIRGVGFILKRG